MNSVLITLRDLISRSNFLPSHDSADYRLGNSFAVVERVMSEVGLGVFVAKLGLSELLTKGQSEAVCLRVG